mmetsp:Transcript_14287/g.14385  ORF Transcript_14287/g.14385 Transcript_14287/m.14385 type:complete len:360 (+) Transcript_14287:767-1846(+)
MLAREDRRMMVVNMDLKLKKLKPKIEQQRVYARDFNLFQEHILLPPPLLSRVMFLLGEEMQGGGMKVICEDPTTKLRLELVLIPLLYPEDEEELNRHVKVLLGRLHSSLLKVVEMSVHMVRAYTCNGLTAMDQRMAVVVLEAPTDAIYRPLLQYMIRYRSRRDKQHNKDEKEEEIVNGRRVFDDADLRAALLQLSGALVALHRQGIIHRNINPDCLTVRDGEELHAQRLLVKLGDYWVLKNPRKAGCEYSYGRGDWGCRETAAPEVLQGLEITTKCDVWGLGICAYYWCNWGVYPSPLLLSQLRLQGITAFSQCIPLCWGEWLSSLLFMCLQPSPSTRASAEKVYNHLVKSGPKKKKKG